MTDTFLAARWENLIMANYEIDPAILQPYLPQGVSFDYYNDKTYVSLVGFMFKKISLFRVPIPVMGTFEEINLRFYVKRTEGDTIKRGVVFISETVPYKVVAWVANALYKEHYLAIPTKNRIESTGSDKRVRYEWKINKQWNHIEVNAGAVSDLIQDGSIEEFIFEHYYGYTRISERVSHEYKVDHPRWKVNKVEGYSIDCDFKSMYGDDFAFLKERQPDSVIIAEGSPVTVKWKRTAF